MSRSLADLPLELLNIIVANLETARSLLYLSLTCKRLHDFTESDGFRVFVQSLFPSIQVQPSWKDAAHGLTTLSRAWDRKAFIAKCVEPPPYAWKSPQGHEEPLSTYPRVRQGRRNRPGRREQTMGYHPVIDSYLDFTEAQWTSRKETMAWGAGPQLNIRITHMGTEAKKASQVANAYERRSYNRFHHHVQWGTYREDWHIDGRDDITSVNLLRSFQKETPANNEQVIIGRASGGLERITLSLEDSAFQVETSFITDNRPIRSADLSKSDKPVLAACLADNVLALYPTNSSINNTAPYEQISVLASETPGRTWSTQFLTHDLLAIGLGPSTEPIHIYSIQPSGTTKTTLRRFHTEEDYTYTDLPASATGSRTNSVYPISPISSSSQAGGADGEIFLSGWYDGVVRLHDMRSPAQLTAKFTDSIDSESAIYSLLPLGQERFVAGGAKHSLMKVFDLRMPGGKRYFAANVDPCSNETSRARASGSTALPEPSAGFNNESIPFHNNASPPNTSSKNLIPGKHSCCPYHHDTIHSRRNWNVYLNPRGPAFYRMGTRRNADSPVYALSAPSSFSPSIYAGVENMVLQFDITSMMDPHPDPIWQYPIDPLSSQYSSDHGNGNGNGPALSPPSSRAYGSYDAGSRDTFLRRKWDPEGTVLRLTLYEQSEQFGDMRLRCQTSIGDLEGGLPGWDERIVEVRGYY
ncbi:hypothetical protein MMC09_006471 [Bachmanniomyces sp. S44760]|nr:hypothetical protein [Bachmanniomyces sp. S44760]